MRKRQAGAVLIICGVVLALVATTVGIDGGTAASRSLARLTCSWSPAWAS